MGTDQGAQGEDKPAAATEREARAPAPRVARTVDAALLALSAFAPAALAATHVGNVATASHDEGVVRVLGLGWTGVWRGADALVAAPFLLLPTGTLAARAALASALVCGLAGTILYLLARRLLAACELAPKGGLAVLGPAIAAVASMTATLSPSWQLESTSVASSGLGAVLALAPLAIALRGAQELGARPGALVVAWRWPLVTLVTLLALTYEPAVGVAALASLVTLRVASRAAPGTATGRRGEAIAAIGLAALLGLAPLAFGLAMRRSMLATLAPALGGSLGEGGASGAVGALLHAELGWIGGALTVGGLGLALFAPAARAEAAALVVLAGVGLASVSLGAPIGPTRYAAPVLAALGALWLLAGVAMQAVARAVAAAPVPLASASASMVILLELTFPALSADVALQRLDARGPAATILWDEVAFGTLPPRAVALIRDPHRLTRLLASRASGELRGDLAIIPLGNIVGRLASRELAIEPKLAPLWRDLLLSAAPDEFGLSSVAASRPLVLPFEPHWERPLSRHFVPAGLLAVFEPEPRGSSDRQRALDALAADRTRLGAALTTAPGARPSPLAKAPDPVLVQLTAALLLDRALTFASTGERELATRALDDARPFAPDARAVTELTRRLAAPTRGPVDVKDLAVDPLR